MPGPVKGLASEPGFNRDWFEFGRYHGGQPGLGGINPSDLLNHNAWDQPFQDPYQAGPNDPTQGQPNPMMAPPPNMGTQMPPMAGNSAGMQPPPQQGNGASFDPQSFADSVMMGLIMGQFTTNPQGAIQMATQWRGARDQRRLQAEQNQLNRDAQQENIRARAEAEAGQKKQADIQKRVAKIQAGLQAGNVPPEIVQQWLADHGGELTEENLPKAESDFAVFQSQAKAKQLADKQATADIANKQKIATTISKSGALMSSEYTKEGTAKYDKAFAESLPAVAQRRHDMDAIMSQLRTARLDRERALTKLTTRKLSDGSPDTSGKARIQRNLKSFGIIEGNLKATTDKLLEAKAIASAYSSLDASDPTTGPIKLNAEQAVATYQAQLNDLRQQLVDNEAEFTELSGKSSAANDIDFDYTGTIDDADIPPEAAALLKAVPGTSITLPKGVIKQPPSIANPSPAASSAPSPGASLPQTEANPGDDVRTYFAIVRKYGPEKADAAWKERHGNAPPPRE